MVWTGLDVHKEFSRMGLFDPATGELLDLGDVATGRQELTDRIAQIPGPKTVVLEAGRNCHYVAAMLEPMADQVWIVDPAEVRKLQKRVAKTDRLDAAALGFWAARGVLEPIWRPDAQTLNLRELTRGKTNLTRMATRLRNMTRSLLARHGYECPKADLLGPTVQKWLETVQLQGYAALMLSTLRELLPIVQAKADALEELLKKEAERHPQAKRLMTIPGVGPFLGLAMAVEVGDARRFAGPSQLRRYSGLCPSVKESAGRVSYGPITKRGNRWLRYAVVLAVQKIGKMRGADARLKRTYLHTAFRHGRNPAKIACARRLLDLAHHLMINQEDYRAPKPRGSDVGHSPCPRLVEGRTLVGIERPVRRPTTTCAKKAPIEACPEKTQRTRSSGHKKKPARLVAGQRQHMAR